MPQKAPPIHKASYFEIISPSKIMLKILTKIGPRLNTSVALKVGRYFKQLKKLIMPSQSKVITANSFHL